MQNFNTNQARHLYVAKALKELEAGADPYEALTEAGDVAVRKTDDGVMQLCYMNGDGLVTRSDAVDVRDVEYVNSVKAEDLAVKLKEATVTVDADVAKEAISHGECLRITVDLLEYMGLDYSERLPVVIDATDMVAYMTADSPTEAQRKAAEKDAEYLNAHQPFAFEMGDGKFTITEKPQRWVRDKLCADPIHFEVRTSVAHGDIDNPYAATAWAAVEVGDSGETLTGDYRIADLECFTHRERSEALGRYAWPDDYEWTPLVQPKAGESQYGMLTVQYFYRGKAEDVQKSPKTLQVAAPDDVVEALKSKIEGWIAA